MNEAEKSLVEMPQLTLGNFRSGAAEELFAEELAKVIRNIQDPNTESSPKREITVKFVFHAAKSRNEASVTCDVTSKLAPQAGVEQTVFVGVLRGKPVATLYDPGTQQTMFDEASRPRALRGDDAPSAAAQ